MTSRGANGPKCPKIQILSFTKSLKKWIEEHRDQTEKLTEPERSIRAGFKRANRDRVNETKIEPITRRNCIRMTK